MKCFQHATVDAFGICRTCGKGVCGICARDLGFGIVCSDPCAQNATAQREIQQRAIHVYQIGNAKQRIPTLTLFLLVFGALITGIAIWDWMSGDLAPWPIFAAGAVFISFAGFTYLRARKLRVSI
jgi:hypothetical protein